MILYRVYDGAHEDEETAHSQSLASNTVGAAPPSMAAASSSTAAPAGKGKGKGKSKTKGDEPPPPVPKVKTPLQIAKSVT